MGHAQLSTTVLYLEAVDAEERNVARRMWEGGGREAPPYPDVRQAWRAAP